MIIYIDISALVKRFIEEPGTNEVNQLISLADILGSSLLTQVEMLSAIGKATRIDG
jgi:predicted nucleic acid-binding protein